MKEKFLTEGLFTYFPSTINNVLDLTTTVVVLRSYIPNNSNVWLVTDSFEGINGVKYIFRVKSLKL